MTTKELTTINELTSEQIIIPETFQKIKKLADYFVIRIQAKEAFFLQEKLNTLLGLSNLVNLNLELYKNYQNLLIPLKWTALPLFRDEEVLEILSNQYLAVLDNENVDTDERMEAKMFTLDLFPRNELRQKMQRALNRNKERLGNKTFGEWLLDYSKTFDFRERDELTPLKYIDQNPDAQILSLPDKERIRKALQIFDKTLLVTPVMSEPLLSMTVRAIIKAGIIKEQVSPSLLQPLPSSLLEESPVEVPAAPKVHTEIPKVAPIKIPVEIQKEPLIGPIAKEIPEKEEEITTYEGKISPYEKKRGMIPPKKVEIKGEYRIRTMKQDIEKTKKQPVSQSGRQAIPKKSETKNKSNIVDLSGK